MACLISSGITRSCGYSFGGLQLVYLANASEVSSVGKDSDGQITGVTMATGATFYQFEQGKKEVLEDLGVGDIVAIYQDQSDIYWYYGELGRGLKASTLSIDTGTADADDAVATIALAGGNRGYANTVDSSIIAALL